MTEQPRDDRHCFRCGRDLGPELEWRKMVTESGPLCYVCYNELQAEARDGEKRS